MSPVDRKSSKQRVSKPTGKKQRTAKKTRSVRKARPVTAISNRHYLDALDELTTYYESIRNTPMAAYLKVLNLASMNMRYEKIAFERSLSDHPFELTRRIIRTQLEASKALFDMLFVEDARSAKPLTGKQSQMEEKHKALFNLVWDKYDAAEYEEYVERYRHRLKVNKLEPLIKGKRCLDLGCGNGNFCFALVDLGASFAAGIDYGEVSIAAANARRSERKNSDRSEFKVSTVYSVDYPDQSFDFVIQNGVFHHLDDEYKAILEAKRLLKPGGHFWYYTDGEGGISYQLWDRSVHLLRNIPQDFIQSVLQSLNVSTGKLVHLMDGLNATYRHTSWNKTTQVLAKAGFGNFKRMVGGFSTDFDHDVISADPYGREKFGEGDLRVLAQRTT